MAIFTAARLAAGVIRSATNEGAGPQAPHLTIDFDDKRLRKALRGKERQIPYALSLGLNKTANSIRRAEVKALHRTFKVRSGWWKPGRRYGINLRKASKKKLEAHVFTRAYWLEDHVRGNTRYPQNRHRAVPKSSHITRAKSGAVSKPWLPGNINKKFTIDFGGGFAGLFSRLGQGRPRTLHYLLIPSARIRPNYDWPGIAEDTFRRRADGYFSLAIRRALKTAR